MKLYGFCQECAKTVEVADVKTVKLPNLSYIQRGRCTGEIKKGEKCNALIFKKIFDTELLIDEHGRKTPQVVFVGEDTPKALYQESKGQTVVTAEEVKVLESAGEVITVEAVKFEIQNKRSGK